MSLQTDSDRHDLTDMTLQTVTDMTLQTDSDRHDLTD